MESEAYFKDIKNRWISPLDHNPPQDIREGYELIAVRYGEDDYGIREVAFCGLPPWPVWTDWYGAVPTPSWWMIIEDPAKFKT